MVRGAQIRAILRKNWLLQLKNKGDLVREVLWPLLLLVVLVTIR